MKHSIKHVLALLTVFSASVAYSADSAYMATICKVVAEEDKLYKVIYQAANEENVTIQLFDEKQHLVYKENLKSAGFSKKFDLTNPPDGDYQIQVKSSGYVFSEDLKIGDISSFVFSFDQKADRKIAMVGAKEQGKSLTLYILDEARDVVYKESFDQDNQVHKSFNFQSLKSGDVTFLLYHDSKLIKEEKFAF